MVAKTISPPREMPGAGSGRYRPRGRRHPAQGPV